jgi:hypothetical protein
MTGKMPVPLSIVNYFLESEMVSRGHSQETLLGQFVGGTCPPWEYARRRARPALQEGESPLGKVIRNLGWLYDSIVGLGDNAAK